MVSSQQEVPTTSQDPPFRAALDMDVHHAAQSLLAFTQSIGHDSSSHLQSIISSTASASQLLDHAADLLLDPALTEAVAVRFRPLPLHLGAQLLSRTHATSPASWADARTSATFCALATLVASFQEVYPLLSALISCPSLAGGPLGAASLQSADPRNLTRMLMATYRTLEACPTAVASLEQAWPSEVLHTIFTSSATSPSSSSLPIQSAGIRLLALETFALQERLSQETVAQLRRRWIGHPSIIASESVSGVPIATSSQQEGVAAEIDAQDGRGVIDIWILPEIERRRIRAARAACLQQQIRFLGSPAQDSHGDDVDMDTGDASSNNTKTLQAQDLSPLVSNVGGVLLPRVPLGDGASRPHLTRSSFVETSSVTPVLSQLAMNLSLGLPMLVSGPPSSGKTELLSHLATLVKQPGSKSQTSTSLQSQILTIQLGDQSGVDAKQLLGSFISSPTKPGCFEWSEGALTRAVRLGMWVVLEDIDKAGSEVLSTVGRLVEQLGPTKPVGHRASIDLGSRGKVTAGEGFALFATRSTLPNSQASGTGPASASKPTFLGNEHWTEIHIASPTQSDVEAILSGSFTRLSHAKGDLLNRLINTWDKVRSASAGTPGGKRADQGVKSSKDVAAGALRTATLRDLIKWCKRVDNLLGPYSAGSTATATARDPFAVPAQQEEIFIEACDVFLSSFPSSTANMAPGTATMAPVSTGKAADRYTALVELLAEELGLSSERAWWALRGRTPELSLKAPDSSDLSIDGDSRPSSIRIGRCELPRQPRTAASRAQPVSRKFAMTKPSLGLLEQLAVCTALSEPVLLVGETGTGKTTVVQYLASLVGRPMTALNLSQQTESGDLIGAFKPLDPKLPATELHDEWTQLFSRTFSSRRNARFLEAERKAFLASKWARLSGLWRESAKMALQRKKDGAEAASEKQSASTPAASISTPESDVKPGSKSRKKRRTDNGVAEGSPVDETAADARLDADWQSFDRRAREFGIQHGSKKRNLVFSFVEGPLVKAIRQGDWVLLDEVNLAAAETLDCLSGLLQSPSASLTLTERGDLEPIPRHPNFRLFACMNPATDVGKKELPSGLRSRFTELYVPSPDSDKDALVAIVEKYIGEHAVGDRGAVMDVAECYAEIRRLAQEHELADGANQRPHFSIRTLSRALTFATDIAPTFGLRRGLWEGFIMSFTLLLDNKSSQLVRGIIERNILAKAKNARAIASFTPPAPKGAQEGQVVQVGPFWLETGPLALDEASDYILTPSVQDKLVGLSRAALTRRFPVLIQGPTSAGKTSAVEYLARRTGHRFVRINNHEHTDVQEYLGSYASDPDTGRLAFQEGLLVKALRRGDWIVLDELNLAPTDVLEALNRLLDDNRELVIPETGEVVRPHPHFMLFATQNPPGLYAGRKVLSRAFRNRFLELHFDDVPKAELETILCNRCAIAPSYAARIVSVFEELQKRRQAGRVFETKQAFVTLRDLFRWGMREAIGYEQLAENGYMLIAERARRPDDKAVVKEVIEQIMKVEIDVASLYDLNGSAPAAAARIGNSVAEAILEAVPRSQIVWTDAVQRLLCLVATALRYNEPVLLVGETGAGKTSVCEVLAKAFSRHLHSVNCHQNTDTADLLGGQRPLRNRGAVQATAKREALDTLGSLGVAHQLTMENSLEDVAATLTNAISQASAAAGQVSPESAAPQDASQQLRRALQRVNQSTALFEWHDGPLVQAMKSGDHLLLDEISLADDSVLERLNSVLEPGRTLVLAERSTSASASAAKDGSDIAAAQIVGAEGFQVIATMNPGGDYGKKELSPALRNRFTEIWVPHIDLRADLIRIVEAQWKDAKLNAWTESLLDFADWFVSQIGGIDQAGIGLRDLLGWTTFMNQTAAGNEAILSPPLAFAHGAALTIIDGLGALPATAAMSRQGLIDLRLRCFAKVAAMIAPVEFDPTAPEMFKVTRSTTSFALGPFSMAMGPISVGDEVTGAGSSFSFGAPTTASNAMRVLRALAIPNKALLLEGSPGAGKTSLISALAKATGNPLTRINLSDQTELVDLFGSDLPVEGGGPGEFAWRDAAFLTAMQKGEWVLLDEMNLASQTVLEGLNSCLDHRGTVFLPELGRSFDKHPNFRFFAAQNPHHQGGGRKGLPKSFLNRFTKVHIEELTPEDILQICAHLYPKFDQDDLRRMIEFNARLHEETMVRHAFGRVGAPWEFNLRDLLRWLTLLHAKLGLNVQQNPIEHLASLYVLRFRTSSDRRAARALYASVFGISVPDDVRPWPSVTPRHVQLGHALVERGSKRGDASRNLAILQHQLPALEALADCVQMRWLGILTGPSGVGKTSVVRLLAQLAGARLEEFAMNSGTDTMDLLGTFEQYDPQAELRDTLVSVRLGLERAIERCGTIEPSQFTILAAGDRLLERELELLVKTKDHKADTARLVQTLGQLSAHSLLAADVAAQQAIAKAIAAVQQHEQHDSSSTSGRFEWTDGPLLRALKEGHWLLLDNANLCSASVLDRLNSLFEPDGLLVISERGVVDGEVPVVRPHPNFRMFMALDARHGELSRAMRNRGIEISMVDASTIGSGTSNLDRERLFDLARVGPETSVTQVDTSIKTDKMLMAACVRSQAARRGIDAESATQVSKQEDLRSMASWAASRLALRDSGLAISVLAAAIVSSTDDPPVEEVIHAAESYLLRATSLQHMPLLTHLLGLGGEQSGISRSALALQVWTGSAHVANLVAAQKRTLIEAHSLPEGFVKGQPSELSYNPNLAALELARTGDADGTAGIRLETLASALLQQIALRTLSLDSLKKDVKLLTVLEQSAAMTSRAQSAQAAAESEEDAEIQSERSTIRQIFPLAVTLSQAVEESCVTGASLNAEQAALIKTLLQTSAFLQRLSSHLELDYSSLQILIQIMAETVKRLESAGLPPSDNVDQALQALGGKVNLTSGFAMKAIWDLCLPKAADARGAELARQISELLFRLPRRSVPSQVALNALDVAATLSLDRTAPIDSQESESLLDLGRKTLASLRGIQKKQETQKDSEEANSTAATQEDAREAFVGSVTDLLVQCMLRANSGGNAATPVDMARLRGFVELVKDGSILPLSAAVPVKSTIWALEAGSENTVGATGPRRAAPSSDWIDRIWSQVSGQSGSSSQIWMNEHAGPAELFRPLLLRAVIDCRSDRISLEERATHDASAKRLAQAAGLASPAVAPSRTQQVRSLLVEFASHVSHALRRSVADTQADDHSSGAVNGAAATVKGGSASLAQIAEEFDTLADSDISSEQKALARIWADGLNEAGDLRRKGPEALMAVGRAWITLATTVLRLYLPNFAIDPVVSQQTRGAFRAFSRESIEAQVQVESSAELLVTGKSDNALVRRLTEQLRQITTSQTKEEMQTIPRDSNLKLLTQLYREVLSFNDQVLSSSKLGSLAEAIQNGFDSQAEDREMSLQSSILAFAQRLRYTYAALHDIIAPVLLVLSQIQLGFRTMVQAARLANRAADTSRHSKVLEALVTFPTAVSTSSYGRLELPVKLKTSTSSSSSKAGALAAPLLLVSIAGIALDAESLGTDNARQQPDVLRRISRTYDQLYHLWVLDREREKQAEEAASTIYKSKRIDEEMAADADAEEREFQHLFPEFADVMDDTAPVNASEPTASSADSNTLLKPPHLVDVYHVHNSLFAQQGDNAAVSKSGESVFYANRSELVRRILNGHYASMGERIDQISAAFQIAAALSPVGAPIGSPLRATSSTAKKFNFYLDPRPDEVSKAITIVGAMRQRLTDLISEWPEQMVLQHIRDRCDAILRLDSASPVAKILSALEHLLMHSEDWEGFASSATSLRVNREQISAQIIEWRRLELSCWARILENQAAEYEDGIAEWWFRLFEVLVRGTRAASLEEDQTALAEHVRKLIDLLDQFIRSSTIGQFEARLRLLDSFSHFMDLLVEQAPREEVKGFADVRVVLKNVSAFFWQFSGKVATSLKQQRDILEKEIRDFIKLASWKDINVHALKTSAQKTHRQLHRCIRKFRDILRQPCDPLLAAHLDGLSRKDLPSVIALQVARRSAVLDESLWSSVTVAVREKSVDMAPHLIHLDQTFQALKEMSTAHLVPGMTADTTCVGVSDLCEVIVDRQQELAKLTPSVATEENEKLVKSLTTQKRKAWNDLLKELRRIGFSAFLKADVAQRNQDSALIYTQEPLRPSCPPSLAGELFDSIEQFHFRLLASLPKVRNSLQAHSPDLSTSELQRGINHIEHCMSLVFAERKRMASILSTFARLEKTDERIASVHAGKSATVVTRSNARTAFVDLADFMQRVRAGLSEIIELAPQHLGVSLFGNMGSDKAMADLSRLLGKSASLASSLSQLAKHAASSIPLFFLTNDESELLNQAQELIDELSSVLLYGEQDCPALSSLLRPTRTWLDSKAEIITVCVKSLVEDDDDGSERVELQTQSNRVISSVLLVAQDLRKREAIPDDGDLVDKAVTAELERLHADQRALRPDAVLAELDQALSLAASAPNDADMRRQLGRLSPFVHEYTTLVQAHLVASANWSRAMLKMAHVLCNLLSALATKGFCKPAPAEEQQGGEDDGADGELESGTGLGDGSGAKDVTDQMQDDEEMEELQKDPNQGDDGDEEDKTEREKNAREADDDFGGDMNEISDEEGEEDQEKDEDDKQQDEPDDAVGDVDPLDPNAVDEKMWGNKDEEKEDKPSADKTDKEAEGGDNDDEQPDNSEPKEDDGGKRQSDSKQKKEQAGDKPEEPEQSSEQGAEQGTEGDKEEQQPEGDDGEEMTDQREQEEGEG